MSKKRAQRSRRQQCDLELISNNQRAMHEGPKSKSWSPHDLKRIKPMNKNQELMFQSWFEGDNIVAYGSAGTGKTFLALYLALYEKLDRNEHQKIIIVRSAVATRDLGHLPGTLEEKTALYELPYHDICHELVGRKSTYQDMKDAGMVEFMTTSFIRGLTWDNAIIVLDEFQNMSDHEIDSVMTRVGDNSRVILAGDVNSQCDISKGPQSGAGNLLRRAETISTFSCIKFEVEDIVRSKFVKDWIMSGM